MQVVAYRRPIVSAPLDIDAVIESKKRLVRAASIPTYIPAPIEQYRAIVLPTPMPISGPNFPVQADEHAVVNDAMDGVAMTTCIALGATFGAGPPGAIAGAVLGGIIVGMGRLFRGRRK